MHSLSILNIAAYRFFTLENPDDFAQTLSRHLESFELKGTVLLAHEGINLFLAGLPKAIEAFQAWMKGPEIPAPLHDLDYKESWSESIPFKRLKVKVKPEIVTFRQLGLFPAQERAPSVAPETLKMWLDANEDVILLDTRNTFEFQQGAFEGSVHLGNDDFCTFADRVKALPEEWKHKRIVTFCTGGIRCEKAAPFMEQQGFEDVYQLEGGILRYFEHVGHDHYKGDCFVFDERIAVDENLKTPF